MRLIRLLGCPSVIEHGVVLDGPRGNKAWALLAYLAGCGAPVPRERLVSMLFGDAHDGLGALRWNLAQLRRALAEPRAFGGDPIELGPTRLDVQLLATAPWYELIGQVDLGAPLLEGMEFPLCPGFELWLEGERARMAGLAAAALREAARSSTAAGRPGEAAGHARRLVVLQPWDETGHEILVRALAQSGDIASARAHVQTVTRFLQEELGVAPSRSLAAAAEPVVALPTGASHTRTSAQLQAGTSAMSAGATFAGVESLARAVAGARSLADAALLVKALTALGSAYVHAVRGSDEAGSVALREAVAVAERAGLAELATGACRELAWIEFLRCRAQAAERWLDRAMLTVGSDASEHAWILLTRGSLRSDAGRHADAFALLREGLAHAEDAGDRRAGAMALTHLGRLHVLRYEDEQATACLRRAQRLAEDDGWLSFLPYPSAWLAEVALHEGRRGDADELFARAHALSVEIGDPCWESLACRGLGLVAAAGGDRDTAAQLLHDARATCRRLADTYVWIEAYGLAAQAAHAVSGASPSAGSLVDDLDRLASAHGMRELQAEAALLWLQMGLPGALELAVAHVSAVDNPVLRRRLARLEREQRRTAVAALGSSGTHPPTAT